MSDESHTRIPKWVGNWGDTVIGQELGSYVNYRAPFALFFSVEFMPKEGRRAS